MLTPGIVAQQGRSQKFILGGYNFYCIILQSYILAAWRHRLQFVHKIISRDWFWEGMYTDIPPRRYAPVAQAYTRVVTLRLTGKKLHILYRVDQNLSTCIVLYKHFIIFGRPFVKRFAPCYRADVLSACNVGALWPNGWMDRDETWHADRPRPWTHCVRWGSRSPSLKGDGAPKFSAHVYCGQTAGWIQPFGHHLDGSRWYLAWR